MYPLVPPAIRASTRRVDHRPAPSGSLNMWAATRGRETVNPHSVMRFSSGQFESEIE
jgi:hypothetical protein